MSLQCANNFSIDSQMEFIRIAADDDNGIKFDIWRIECEDRQQIKNKKSIQLVLLIFALLKSLLIG